MNEQAKVAGAPRAAPVKTLRGKQRYKAGVLEYKRMGYWEPDYRHKDTDLIALFRVMPQDAVDSIEAAAGAGQVPPGLWRALYPPLRFRGLARLGIGPLSFIVNRPVQEPGFRLLRQEVEGRNLRYTTHADASELPEGKRYNSATKR
jgi:hypothetical protein